MQAPKNGFFYVIDRENGKLLSAEKLGEVNWADHIDLTTGRPVERPGIRYEKVPVLLWPGAYGRTKMGADGLQSRNGARVYPDYSPGRLL